MHSSVVRLVAPALVWSCLAFGGEIHDAALKGDLQKVRRCSKTILPWFGARMMTERRLCTLLWNVVTGIWRNCCWLIRLTVNAKNEGGTFLLQPL